MYEQWVVQVEDPVLQRGDQHALLQPREPELRHLRGHGAPGDQGGEGAHLPRTQPQRGGPGAVSLLHWRGEALKTLSSWHIFGLIHQAHVGAQIDLNYVS